MPTRGATRIAPTPSGFLHQGNLVNFLLTSKVSDALGLSLRLRIDDLDRERTRPAYVEDIFRWLDWLGISPTLGPTSPVELEADSQADASAYFWEQLELMVGAGLPAFVCSCSRALRPGNRCERGCSQKLSDLGSGASGTVRCELDGVEQTLVGLHRRPSYHLVNVVLDRDHGTTHIVRGADLAPSSVYHQALSRFLPGSREIKYAHHPLLLTADGSKLSKSQGTARLEPSPALLDELTAEVARLLPSVLAQF